MGPAPPGLEGREVLGCRPTHSREPPAVSLYGFAAATEGAGSPDRCVTLFPFAFMGGARRCEDSCHYRSCPQPSPFTELGGMW